MKIALLAIALLLSTQAQAVDEEFLYSIGGAMPLSKGASNRVNTHKLGVGIKWNADLTCGNFDLAASVENQLSDAVDGFFDDLMNTVVGAVEAYVANLPAMVIQRLNPALYDLLQNGILQASAEFNISKASCRQIADNMSNAVAEDGWSGLAEGGWWAEQSTTAEADDADIIETEKKAKAEAQNAGVTWIGGGQAGGVNQEPIFINRDAALAGYNLLLKRGAANIAPVSESGCAEATICTVWKSPLEAAEWVTDVIGDKTIQTCIDCEKMAGTAGQGLNAKYESEQILIAETLTLILTNKLEINATSLALVQGDTGFRVSRPLVEAMMEESQPEIIINRMSGELAMAKTMERALLARRTLLAGLKEPNVANNELAQAEIRQGVDEITDEIEGMVFEMEVREKMGSETALALLQRARTRGQAPVSSIPSVQDFSEGAVSK